VPATALIGVPGLLLLGSWIFFASSSLAGIPTATTISAASDALTQSWDSFGNIVAPAPALPGFVMASCAALFFAVFLADWAAFRLWSAFEAIVPASTLFVFCSLLGGTDHKVDSAAIFLAALMGFLLLHRIARQETSAGWLTADIDRGSQAGLRTGAALTAVALLAGVLLGPHLPGADSTALISWRGTDAGGNGTRITISPLVDIKDRLVNKTNVELFTVQSNEKSYWRMTSLDTFADNIWRSGGKFTAVDGDLDASLPPSASSVKAQQTYNITNLNVLWVPAAFQPTNVDSPNVDVRYQANSSTLIVNTQQDNSNGMTYSVTSVLPRFTKDQLEKASPNVPSDVKTEYEQLPDGFSNLARTEAIKAVTGAATPYDKALALQNYFQSGAFTYSTDVPAGHGESAIDTFLRNKVGYCEQYAGTYAAMARSIGLPARVAVGFTPGDVDPNNPNLYHVRGEHAHAWPEVYLGEYGWVPFEPTPQRGAPGAEAWTGLPERQENNGQTESPTSAPTTIVTSPTTVAGAVTPPTTVGPTTTLAPETTDVTADSGVLDSWVVRLALFGLVLVALAGMYAFGVMSVKDARVRRRRHGAGDPSARVRVAWEESVEALALLGAHAQPTETHEEFALRAGPKLDESSDLLLDLAHDADAASYAPDILTDEVADRAQATSVTVVEIVHEKAPKEWKRSRIDIRPLLPHLRPSSRRRAGSKDR
jgi:transglutaminase-like putative cysteine protease